MKFQKLLLLALGANLVLMGFIAASPSQDTFDRIRVHEFQLVDDRNQERASIKIEDLARWSSRCVMAAAPSV